MTVPFSKGESLVGATIGRWLVSGVAGKVRGNIMMRCKCACGVERTVRLAKLEKGQSKSCGCQRDEALVTHGHTKRSVREGSREYWIWNTMVQRCMNPNSKQWADYGGRGITVCERWLTFENFYQDMGPRPPGMTLDRGDNDAGYSPGNCRWVGRAAQARNKRNNHFIEANGISQTIADWAKASNISHSTIIARIKAGWDPSIAVTAARNSCYDGSPCKKSMRRLNR